MRTEVARGNKPTYASQAVPAIPFSWIYRAARELWNTWAKLLVIEFCDKGYKPAGTHLCNCMCMSSNTLHFSHTNIHRTPLSDNFIFFSPKQISMKQPFSLQGWEIHFFCLPQRFSLFHENFKFKDFGMLRFSSQKIVNLSGTQHLSWVWTASTGCKHTSISSKRTQKKPHKNKQTHHKVFRHF